MNESSDKKVDTSYKKCSREKLPFAPLRKRTLHKRQFSAPHFLPLIPYFMAYYDILCLGSYSYYTGGAFDGDFFAG